MIALIRKLLDNIPLVEPLRRARWFYLSKQKLKKEIKSHKGPLKVIIGAMNTRFEGWIATNYQELNITKPSDWRGLFAASSVSNLLAEHVLEHVDMHGLEICVNEAFRVLKPGGVFRVAVPDGYHPDPEYIDMVKPCDAETLKKYTKEQIDSMAVDGKAGTLGDHNHQLLLNYKLLSEVFEKAGFQVELLEYYDENGTFYNRYPGDENGFVQRVYPKKFECYQFNPFTSLVIDAIKPQ